MTPAAQFSLWKSLKLRRKFFAVALAFTAVLAGLIAFNIWALRNQAQQSLASDIAGRQRMLSQKVVKEALLSGSGLAGSYQGTMKMLRDSLGVLTDGGEIAGSLETGASGHLSGASNGEIREKLTEQAALLQQYEAAAAVFTATGANDPKRVERLKDFLGLQAQVSESAESAVKLMGDHGANTVQSAVALQILVGMLCALVGLVISSLIGRQIADPLAACADAARKVAEGDLSIEPLPVSSADEIGVLQTAFNDMVKSQRDITVHLRTVCDALTGAATAILSSAQQQAAGTKQQAAAVQEITTTVEEISLSGKQVAERSRQVAGTAEAVATSGTAGLQAVRDASAGMEAIREQTETVAENIITLSERTQAVGEIIATVNEIAEQSNLVALNAAIEAADAREQGRRFSVVANEIKNLADQAKEATSQVRGILEQTQKGINTSVMLTEEALKRVESGREKSTVSEHAIRQMSDNIQESVHAFQQIVGATNQQQIGLEQVTQALHEIRQASQQTAVTTAQLEKASIDLSQLGQKLAQTLEKFRL